MITSGNSIESPDGQFKLVMENGGNLVLYDGADVKQWESNTSSGLGTFLNFQNDGNLVVYNSSIEPQWFSGTYLTSPSLPSGAKGIVLYLPGPSSECECTQYMCIIVETAGGAKTNYYAVTNGPTAFFETVTGC